MKKYLSVLFLALAAAAHADGPKVDGLLQAWAVDDTTATSSVLNYRIRRAEIKLSGSNDEMRYVIMADPAKTPGADAKILQDAFVGVKLADGLELIAGQTKIQTTAEGLDPTAELWFPERSLQARTYGDIRQPGAMLQYSNSDLKVGFMAANGVGTNQDDTNNYKDLTARVDYKLLDELAAGAFVRATNSALYPSNAYGFNARLKPLDELELRGDLAEARVSAVYSTGYTLDAGYKLDKRLMPVLRYDYFQANNANSLVTRVYEAGLNYNLGAPNTKVEATYGITNNVSAPGAASGTYTPGVNHGTITTLAFQAAF